MLAERTKDVDEEKEDESEEKSENESPPDEGGGAIARLAGASVKGEFFDPRFLSSNPWILCSTTD